MIENPQEYIFPNFYERNFKVEEIAQTELYPRNWTSSRKFHLIKIRGTDYEKETIYGSGKRRIKQQPLC